MVSLGKLSRGKQFMMVRDFAVRAELPREFEIVGISYYLNRFASDCSGGIIADSVHGDFELLVEIPNLRFVGGRVLGVAKMAADAKINQMKGGNRLRAESLGNKLLGRAVAK